MALVSVNEKNLLFIQPESIIEFVYLIWIHSVLFMLLFNLLKVPK